jgi:hypothetical protein
MDIPQMRAESNVDYLIRYFSKPQSVTLWQNITSYRTWKKVKFMKLTDEGKMLRFMNLDNSKIGFSPIEPIYFFGPKNCGIFKSQIKFQNDIHVDIAMPYNMMFKEFRHTERIDLQGEREVISIELPHLNNKIFTKSLINYTETGISIAVKTKELPHYYTNDKVIIKGHPNLPIEQSYGLIRHLTPINQISLNKWSQVGIELLK